MMHYGFCRKHADQIGEGGCPECAMDHQQATISALTETAKEASRAHVEMHNQIAALQAEVARQRAQIITGICDTSEVGVTLIKTDYLGELRTRISELEAGLREIAKGECDCEWLTDMDGTQKIVCDACIAHRLLDGEGE